MLFSNVARLVFFADLQMRKATSELKLLLSVDVATEAVLSEPNVIFTLKIEQRIAMKDFLKGGARLCFGLDLMCSELKVQNMAYVTSHTKTKPKQQSTTISALGHAVYFIL